MPSNSTDPNGSPTNPQPTSSLLTETAPTPEKPAEPTPEKPAEPAADAPLVYDFKLPDGIEPDLPAIESLKGILGEHKVPPEAGQKLVDLYQELQTAQVAAWTERTQQWAADAKADPFLSGKEVAAGGFRSFDEAKAAIGKATAKYLDADTRAFLDQMGLGNHPGLARTFAKIGRDLAEGQTVPSSGSAPGNGLRDLYPNSPQMFS